MLMLFTLVHAVQGIQSIAGDTVTFTDGRSVEADMILLATGYTQRFPFLYDHPKSEGEDPLPGERFVVNTNEPRLGFIGMYSCLIIQCVECLCPLRRICIGFCSKDATEGKET